MVSVADELFFEHWLEGLEPMNRAAVDRVLESRGYGSRITHDDVSMAREDGYERGLKAGRAEQKPAA